MGENMKYSKSILGVVYTCAIFAGGIMYEKNADHIYHMVKKWFHKPMVSVVLSTYNRAHALPIAIESILDQTYTDFELIVIDDGSTDNTEDQIRYYAANDPRVVHLSHKPNKGLVYSLNQGLDAARGKYIVRMDDDDKAVPFRLERQVRAMEAHPEITVLGSGIIDPMATPKKAIGVPKINDPDEIEINTYFSSGLAHPTIIVRRDFIEKNHIRYNEKYLYAEDTGFYKDIMEKGGRISSMNEGLLHFGYTKDVSHPDKYSYIQSESFKTVQQEKLKPFFDAPREILGAFVGNDKRCVILTNMVSANKTKKILNQDILERRQKDTCAYAQDIKDSVSVKHPYWSDYVHVNDDKKTFYRLDNRAETGKITKEDKDTITIKWDRWDVEVYKKESDKKWVYIKDGDGTVKK